ncbi:MAG: hypothetical protein FWE95_05925 [Planctomycetaceae bacterium]|nr:hypothetical protein [Planctomycetaceae bacterium]
MQDKPSRTTPVIAGFALCLLLMCVIAFTAFYAVQVIERMTHEQSQAAESVVLFGQVSQQFNAAQIAVLKFRETNERALEEPVALNIQVATEAAHEFSIRLHNPETKKLLMEQMESHQHFEAFFRKEVMLQEEITRAEMQQRQSREVVLSSLGKIEALLQKIDADLPEFSPSPAFAIVGEVRETTLQIALLQRALASPDQKIADVAREEMQRLQMQVRTLLGEFDQNTVTDSMRALVRETISGYGMLIETTDEWAQLHTAQRQVREELDAIAEKAEAHREEIRERYKAHLEQLEWYTARMVSSLKWLLLTCCFVALMIGVITGFVVVRMVNRESAPVYSDGFSSPEPSAGADMRIVADRLQEVVNLLRK